MKPFECAWFNKFKYAKQFAPTLEEYCLENEHITKEEYELFTAYAYLKKNTPITPSITQWSYDGIAIMSIKDVDVLTMIERHIISINAALEKHQ